MNKQIFLEQLAKQLKSLSKSERDEIIHDYIEYFAVGMSEGKTEQDIIYALGTPKQIGKELLATYHIDNASTTASLTNILRAVWAVIGLSFFNVIVVLAPFVALIGIVFAGWSAGISFLAAPILFIINIIIYPNTFLLFDLFASLGLCSIGFFLLIGMYYTTKFFIKMLAKYLKFNARFIRGGLQHE
ncbi:DUF1700 domain-containing protein [Paenibacillus yanchengensis]|uniref:DUF1700 domain-containing protein n=1 Tax=Paenibacillus yanchengensis TaxID=2035833 RepID=A0ABW4YLK2_9BACL